jgi:Glycosyl hydrolase family 3 N terminal domain
MSGSVAAAGLGAGVAAPEVNPRPPPHAAGRACHLPPLRTQLAQLLLVGFPGTTANAASRRLVDQGVGGLVLFGRNVASAGQVRSLLRALRSRAEIPLEVAVDQEPGLRVARLAGIVRGAPAARRLGRLPSGRVYRYGLAMGRDLAALGITTDLAPVLDVTGARGDGVIGDRSFGADPATVSRAGVAFMRGLAAGGVATVGKHFPGHGATTVDSHLRLPVVAATPDRLASWDLLPFRAAIRTGLPAVMVGHLVVRGLDGHAPATLSRAVIGGLLRKRLGFDGLVVSDALEMARSPPPGRSRSPPSGPWPPAWTSCCCRTTPGWTRCWTAWRGRWRPAGCRGRGSGRRSCASNASSASAAGPPASRSWPERCSGQARAWTARTAASTSASEVTMLGPRRRCGVA